MGNTRGAKADRVAKIPPGTLEYKEARAGFLTEYYAMRKQREKSLLGRLSFKKRRALHPIMLQVIKPKNRLDGLSVEVLHDHRGKVEGPVILQ